jgi:hypothetical protein
VTSVGSAPTAIAVQPFSLTQATILDSPDNFAFFAETAKITTLVMGPFGINVDFTKKNLRCQRLYVEPQALKNGVGPEGPAPRTSL